MNINNLSYLEQLELYERNEALAEWYVSRIPFQDRNELDDLRQVAKVALWQACQQYEQERGGTFSTFAVKKMEWYIKNYSSSCKKRRESETYIENSEGKTVSLDDIAECISFSSLFEQWMTSLEDDDREIVEMKIQGMKNREIAEKLHRTPACISIRLKNLRKSFPSLKEIT